MDRISLGEVNHERQTFDKSIWTCYNQWVLRRQWQSRRALIYKDDSDNLNVELWEDQKLREVRNLREHNIHYAEDCAENWVTRVIVKPGQPAHISEDK